MSGPEKIPGAEREPIVEVGIIEARGGPSSPWRRMARIQRRKGEMWNGEVLRNGGIALIETRIRFAKPARRKKVPHG